MARSLQLRSSNMQPAREEKERVGSTAKSSDFHDAAVAHPKSMRRFQRTTLARNRLSQFRFSSETKQTERLDAERVWRRQQRKKLKVRTLQNQGSGEKLPHK